MREIEDRDTLETPPEESGDLKDRPMTRTKIEQADFTWNPVVGCNHGCTYCYARRIAGRFGKKRWHCDECEEFTPHPHPERLNGPTMRKKPAMIIVCSMADLFGSGVEPEWQQEVMKKVSSCQRHTYQFLTKQPQNLGAVTFDNRCWVGTSVDEAEHLQFRFENLLKAQSPAVRFLQFEPLLTSMPITSIDLSLIDWIVIGKQTGGSRKEKTPYVDWAKEIVNAAEAAHVPVWLKDCPEWPNPPKEWPHSYQPEITI